MTTFKPPRAMRLQIEAADAACAELGLPVGAVDTSGAGGHVHYLTRDPETGRTLKISIASTPRSPETEARRVKSRLRFVLNRGR